MSESHFLLQKKFMLNNHQFEITINDSLKIDITRDKLNITEIEIMPSEFIEIKKLLFTMVNEYSQLNSDYNQTAIQGILTNKTLIHPSKLALNSNINKNSLTINDIETIYKLTIFEEENTYKNKIIAHHPKYDTIISMISMMNPIDPKKNTHLSKSNSLSNLLVLPEEYADDWIQKLDNYYKYKYLIINSSLYSDYLVKTKSIIEKLNEYTLFIVIIDKNKLNYNIRSFIKFIESQPITNFHRIFYYYCDINGLYNNKCLYNFNLESNFNYHRVYNFELYKSNIIDFYLKYGFNLSSLNFKIKDRVADSLEMESMNNHLQFIVSSQEENLHFSKIEFKKENINNELNYIDHFIYKEFQDLIKTAQINLKENYFDKLYINQTNYNFSTNNTLLYQVDSKAPKYLSLLTDIFSPEIFKLLEDGNLKEFITETNIKYDTTQNIVTNIMANMYENNLQEKEVNQKIKCIQERLDNANECVICLGKIKNPTILNCCQNKCCLECILHSYKSNSACPFCRNKTHYLDNLTVLNNEGQISNTKCTSVTIVKKEEISFNISNIITKCKSLDKINAITYIIQQIQKYTSNSKTIILLDRNYKIYNMYDSLNNHPYDWDEITSALSKISIRPNVHQDDDFHNDNHRTYLIYKNERSNIYHIIRNLHKKNNHQQYYTKLYFNKTNHFSYDFKQFDLQNCTDIIIPQHETPQSISNIKLFSETLNTKQPIRIWQVTCNLENK